MDTQTGQEQTSKITLNLDEFDIDTYDFKPVTRGLGFHDPLEKSKRVTKQTHRATRTRNSASSAMKASHLQNTPMTVSDPSLMSGIDALYGNKPLEGAEEVKLKETPLKKVTAKVKEASYFEMACAFIVDFLTVIFINLILFSSFYGFAFKSFDVLGIQSFILAFLPYFAILLSLIFVSYYSLLEPMGTPGKRLWGIKTVSVGTNKAVTIKMSFIRSLITLCSIPLFFFPLIFDFQGKLSDSTVIENK